MGDDGSTKNLLSKLGVTPDKAFGQNFVLEPSVIDQIIAFGKPNDAKKLVEIGPGLGALTSELVTFGDVTAVEIEEEFCKHLSKKLPSLNLINEDIRSFDLTSLGEELVVFGNIPYSFSSEILFYLLENASVVKRAILLVQREFAERVASDPGPKSYGVPSIRTKLLANTRLGPIFPGNIFYPPATVESRLLELRFLDAPRFEVRDELHFKLFLATCFGSRRRKIFNTLLTSGQYPEDSLKKALSDCGVAPEARVETVTVEQFVGLSNSLFESGER